MQADSVQALQRMQQSTGSSKTSWQLLAVRALLREGKDQQAVDLFSQLPPEMDKAQQMEPSLLAVEPKLGQADMFLVWFSLSGTVVRVGIDTANQTMANDISLFERVRWLNPWFMPAAGSGAIQAAGVTARRVPWCSIRTTRKVIFTERDSVRIGGRAFCYLLIPETTVMTRRTG
ncbi:TPA: hypothetical protein I3599_004738 [Enterobacter cloacae]|nr:hypothetical protein [Enterobacter cloacae]